MARMRALAERAEQVLGTAVVSTTPVAGGDVCTATRLRLSDGRSALMKTRPYAPEGFFEAEAAGLRWLRETGGDLVAEVIGVTSSCLIVEWVEPARATPEAAADLGRRLASLHASGAESFGGTQDGFIGALPMPNKPAETWPEFYAVRRVLPYLKLSVDRGRIEADDAAAVEQVVKRIVDLAGPEEPPARLHGDLWSGNLLWTDETAVLIDPAAYGGHREVDLAMLQLFGAPELTSILAGYQDQHRLAPGWQDRVELYQLFPLLVHAVIFGGSYGAAAGDAAGRCLRRHRP